MHPIENSVLFTTNFYFRLTIGQKPNASCHVTLAIERQKAGAYLACPVNLFFPYLFCHLQGDNREFFEDFDNFLIFWTHKLQKNLPLRSDDR